jgi:hypothetical protein
MLKQGKNRVILEKICFTYLPDMFPTKESQGLALKYPNAYNVEHLVELALAKVGGYNWVDEEGYDFDDADFSDSKTCTLRCYDGQLGLTKIQNKIGSFRMVIYNEFKDDLHFIYLTSKGRERWIESGYLQKKPWEQRIRTSYNESKDSYNKLEEYRVSTFVELARMSDESFKSYKINKDNTPSFVNS